MRDCVTVTELWKCPAGEEMIDCDDVKVAMRTTECEEICDEVKMWAVYIRCVIWWGLFLVFQDALLGDDYINMVRVLWWSICYFEFVTAANESATAVLWGFQYIGLDLMPWAEGRIERMKGGRFHEQSGLRAHCPEYRCNWESRWWLYFLELLRESAVAGGYAVWWGKLLMISRSCEWNIRGGG